MKKWRSFSCGCFCFLAGRCQSCGVRSPSCSVSVASCARCQSRCAQSPRREESRVIASSVVSRRLSPRRQESRVIASSVVSRRLSSRCASSSCSECQSRRVRSRVGVSRVSSCVVPLLGVSRVVCGVLPLCLSALCAVASLFPFFSDSMDDVFFRPVLTRRVFFLF